MSWAFATINGRLAEFFWDTKKDGTNVINGHCYVERSEYNKREKKMIDTDIAKYRFSYRNKKYRRMNSPKK
jgi:hypothetical protein